MRTAIVVITSFGIIKLVYVPTLVYNDPPPSSLFR